MKNENKTVSEQIARATPARVTRGSVLAMGGQSLQNVVFSAMVGLGCWGMAFFFIFFYSEEPNHYLYGGIMAVTALIWSLIAVRKWSMYQQRA
jgi:hypothetical protein